MLKFNACKVNDFIKILPSNKLPLITQDVYHIAVARSEDAREHHVSGGQEDVVVEQLAHIAKAR